MNKINFLASDKLVIDGYDNLSVDLLFDWNNIELASPLSIDAEGKVHPFVTGETFIGVLSYNGVKNVDIDIKGVNIIEASYLKGGYYFHVRASDTITIGAKLKADVAGFSTTTSDDAVCIAVSAGTNGEVIRVRGGNY